MGKIQNNQAAVRKKSMDWFHSKTLNPDASCECKNQTWTGLHADQSLEMATFTLQQMASGGMYDQIGGGFHRYSVDEHWHIPHFEKMLYDNPQLASTYLDAFALTGDRTFAEVARGILDYVRRDMTHPKGGIFSAEVQLPQRLQCTNCSWRKCLRSSNGVPMTM